MTAEKCAGRNRSLPASDVSAAWRVPTTSSGPGCAAIARVVMATSSSSDIVGFWTTLTP